MTIRTEFERAFFAGFFLIFFFFLFLRPRRKYAWNHPPSSQKPRQKSSSKVRRNTSPQEPQKNYPKRRQSQPYTQISKVDMSSNTQNYKHGKGFEDIKKQV